MESFEHVCKVALEAEGFIVTTNVKFPVRRQTRRADRDEFQTHGYEVDLVGARMDALVLASVKSFLGSRGVNADAFVGLVSNPTPRDVGGYKLFNDSELRNSVKAVAAERYGYELDQIKLRLYVGKFAGGDHRDRIIDHLARLDVEVKGLEEIVDAVLAAAESKTYTDDPVFMTVKALKAAHRLG
jgi:hypothetical protein